MPAGRRAPGPGLDARNTSFRLTPRVGTPRARTMPSPTSRSSGAISISSPAMALIRFSRRFELSMMAAPAVTTEREAKVPAPNGISAVSPALKTTASGVSPKASATTCDIVVSSPWPWGAQPE